MGKIQLDEKGLVPAIAQDADTGQVLMLGYMSPAALKRTLDGGDVWFYSRSRADLWHKGETSGNFMRLRSASVDCDGDVLLLQVKPEGPICHTGNQTCFFTPVDQLPEFAHADAGPRIADELFSVIQDRRRERPEGSYTAGLLEQGVDRIGQKVVKEAGEVALAGGRGDREGLVQGLADLVYHALMLLSASGVRPGEVWERLRERRR